MQEFKLHKGAILRMAELMTHYRKPRNHSETKMQEAEKILRRFVVAAVPNTDEPVPIELLEEFGNDVNTPGVVALLHQWRKDNPKKLFSALRFLGFFEIESTSLPDEWKMLPDEDSPVNKGIFQ